MTHRHPSGLLTRSRLDTVTHTEIVERSPKRDYLLAIDIFGDLRPEDFVALDHRTVTLTFPRGRILFSQEDRAEALYLLKRGRVRRGTPWR